MSKKIIIIIASVAAALALIAGLTVFLVSVFKVDKGPDKVFTEDLSMPAVTVDSVTGSAGKTVEVPVKFTGNPGAMGFFLEFDYDSDKLEYVSFKKGELLTDCEVSDSSGSLKLVSVENGDVKKDGTLVYLSFKVRDGASGDCEIKLICDENSICNYEEESIPVKTVNGKITVK